MQCIVLYAAGVYVYLSKIRYEIQIFNFGNPSSGHSIYGSKDVKIRGYFFEAKRCPWAKKFGKH